MTVFAQTAIHKCNKSTDNSSLMANFARLYSEKTRILKRKDREYT